MIPIAEQMLKRFTKYNKTDFFEISKIKKKFTDTVGFVFKEAGMDHEAINKMLNDCTNYLQSAAIESKLKGLELLKDELKPSELCKFS